MYRVFCAIEVLHRYFADGRCRGVRLVPTADCRRILSGHRMTARQLGNRVYVLAWTDDTAVPQIPIAPETVFRFHLVVDDPSFFYFTGLPFDPAGESRLHCSNLAGHAGNGRLYLTTPNPAFDPTANYAVGDLAAGGAGLFECIGSVAGAPGNLVTDPLHWAARGEVRSPGVADAVPFGDGDVTIRLAAPVTGVTVTIFGLNRTNNQYDAVVLTDTLTFATPTVLIPVRLGSLPAGRYRVQAGGVERDFYHDPERPARALLGVVEIFNHLPAASSHAVLDGAGRVKGSTFSVIFLNPLLVWKYIARTANVKKIRDESGTYAFDDTVPLEFRSTTPIPLTEKAYDQIAMEYKPAGSAATIYPRVVNPAPGRVKRVRVGGDTLSCAEIYLNY